MNKDDSSFRLDRKSRSFRVSDFALRDLPLLGIALVLLSIFSVALGWFIEFLPASARWLPCGVAVGFYFGVVVGSASQRSAQRRGNPASPVVPVE